MKYIEAPEIYSGTDENKIFLAGGITNCYDWQSQIVEMLKDTDFVIFNPRRKEFPIHDANAAIEQITWEFNHLKISDYILFWFSPETLNPIVLYELGYWISKDKKLFIGIHPDYQRRHDVIIQTALARGEKFNNFDYCDIEIVYSLQRLADQVLKYILLYPSPAKI